MYQGCVSCCLTALSDDIMLCAITVIRHDASLQKASYVRLSDQRAIDTYASRELDLHRRAGISAKRVMVRVVAM